MSTRASAPIDTNTSGPRIGTYSEQSLYAVIQRQMSARVEQEISVATGGMTFLSGFSDRPARARAAVTPASQLIASTLMRHQQEDIATATAAVTGDDGEAKMDTLAATRAFEVRQALAGNRQIASAFELTDAKLTEMTGVDSQGKLVRGSDTLFTQLQSTYANELGHQNNLAIAKLEAEAAKTTKVASADDTQPVLPAAPPKPAPQAVASVTPPAAPAAGENTPPQGTTAETTSTPPAGGTTTAQTLAPADDAAAKLAELKARQTRLAAAERERQQQAEIQDNTDTVAYTPTAGGGSGGGGLMDTIMGFLGGMTDGWNENVGGRMKRGANWMNENGFGWVGPLAILAMVGVMAFTGNFGLVAALLVGFMGLMAAGGFGLFGSDSAQAGTPGANPISYDQPQQGRDGPMQNISYDGVGTTHGDLTPTVLTGLPTGTRERQ